MIKDTIQTVVERMKKYSPLYVQNEMAVRDQLVNPVLRSLAWNSENPEEIQPDVSSENGIPGFSLLKDSKKALFIEVKNLSADIEKGEAIHQLASYCFSEGMKYGVLTNGSIWILFRSQEEATLAERVVWKTDLENDDVTAIIRRLNTISKENIENIETLLKKLQILEEVWQAMLDEPKHMVKGFTYVFDGLIKEGYPGYGFDPAEIEDFVRERVRG